jgi:hypothetical protein
MRCAPLLVTLVEAVYSITWSLFFTYPFFIKGLGGLGLTGLGGVVGFPLTVLGGGGGGGGGAFFDMLLSYEFYSS